MGFLGIDKFLKKNILKKFFKVVKWKVTAW